MEIGRDFNMDFDKRRKRKRHPPFSISDEDRLKHVLVAGKTGLGKSTLLANMIRQDIIAGNGFAVLDPHGTLIEEILELIPDDRVRNGEIVPGRIRDVILLDFSDFDFPVAFNILHAIPPAQRPTVASSIVDAFKAAAGYQGMSTPQMDMVLYTATAALLDMPDATLLGIKYILTSKEYRKRITGHVKDSVLKDIWESDYEKLSDKDKREYGKSTLNKIIQLITDPAIKNVIGQPETRFDIKDVMDSRKILLIKIPQGQLGVEKTKLVGSFIVSLIHSNALQRKASSPFFAFYCDEFHNFHGWREMLSGLRKFNVSLTLATQFLGQLDEATAAAVEGTVETIVSFRLGPTDAEKLSKMMQRVKVSDLVGLQPYHTHVTTGPRTAHLIMSPAPENKYPKSPEKIRTHSRETYGMRREVVEKRIASFVEHT